MFLDPEALEIVFNIINKWWQGGTFPKEKLKAYVASIYKKGDPLKTANYRPISLLPSIYKIYTGLLQKRLASAIDHDVASNQYGFRKCRSTSQPLLCVRRLLDRAEATKTSFVFNLSGLGKSF